jgi:hypothetical protein
MRCQKTFMAIKKASKRHYSDSKAITSMVVHTSTYPPCKLYKKIRISIRDSPRQSSCHCAPTNQEHSKCNFLCFFIICQFGVEKVAPNEQGLIWSGESSKGVNELSSLAHMIHHRGQAGFDGRHIQISEFCAKNANHQADGLEWTP